MDHRDIGVLAIFLGTKRISKITKLSPEQCQFLFTEAARKEAKLCSMIVKMIIEKVQATSFTETRSKFGISEAVLETLTRFFLNPYANPHRYENKTRQKRVSLTTNPQSSIEVPKQRRKRTLMSKKNKEKTIDEPGTFDKPIELSDDKVSEKTKTDFFEPMKYVPPPHAFDNDPVIPPPTKKPKLKERSKRKTPSKKEKIPPAVLNNTLIIPEENLTETVRNLYKMPKITANHIKLLFEIPSMEILHQMGDFSRKIDTEMLIEIREEVRSLMSSGVTEKELIETHGFDHELIKQVYNPSEREKLVYTSVDIEYLFELKVFENSGMRQIANSLGVPFNTVKRWCKNKEEGKPFNEGIWYASDDEGSSYQKVKGVEIYLRTKDLEQASQEMNAETIIVEKWYDQFKKYYSLEVPAIIK